jgi:hypothetical protein
VAGILAALEREAAAPPRGLRGCTVAPRFAAATLAALRQRSPTSLKVTFEALTRVAPTKHPPQVTFAEALRTEYRLAQRFVRAQPASDFVEGVRAVLVDKDHAPAWDPPTLDGVDAAAVEAFFAPLEAGYPRGELDVSFSEGGAKQRRLGGGKL